VQIAAEHVQARADVALQLRPTEDLGRGAGGLTTPHLELEEPIARGGVALREEQIVLVLRVDVIDAPMIPDDIDRLVDTDRDNVARGGGPGGGSDRRRRQSQSDDVCEDVRMFARTTPIQILTSALPQITSSHSHILTSSDVTDLFASSPSPAPSDT
jgi:hypothetical protein